MLLQNRKGYLERSMDQMTKRWESGSFAPGEYRLLKAFDKYAVVVPTFVLRIRRCRPFRLEDVYRGVNSVVLYYRDLCVKQRPDCSASPKIREDNHTGDRRIRTPQ